MAGPNANQRPQPHTRIPTGIPYPNRHRAAIILNRQLHTTLCTSGRFGRVDDIVDVRDAAHEGHSLWARIEVANLDFGVVPWRLPGCRLEGFFDFGGREAVADGGAGGAFGG